MISECPVVSGFLITRDDWHSDGPRRDSECAEGIQQFLGSSPDDSPALTADSAIDGGSESLAAWSTQLHTKSSKVPNFGEALHAFSVSLRTLPLVFGKFCANINAATCTPSGSAPISTDPFPIDVGTALKYALAYLGTLKEAVAAVFHNLVSSQSFLYLAAWTSPRVSQRPREVPVLTAKRLVSATNVATLWRG